MIRLWFAVSGILGLSAMLAVSAPAWAHVVVSPEVLSAPQSSPLPSEASASREKAAGGEAKVLAETGGTNLAVYAGLGFVGVVLSALLAQRLLG
jgi:hypothetical protein